MRPRRRFSRALPPRPTTRRRPARGNSPAPPQHAPEWVQVAGLETRADDANTAGCCASEGCCDPSGKLIGGVGLYLIEPFFANNPAISFFVQGTGPGRREDIRQHLDAAPLFWLGYMLDNGLGVRARWWFFRQGTDQNYTFAPPNGGTVTVLSAAPLGAVIIQDNPQAFAVTSKLQLHVVDLEAFQDTTLCNWNFLLSGGLGFADVRQDYNAFAIAASGATIQPLTSGRRFGGLGPVFALEARRPLFDCGLNLYSSARTRILFGSADQTVTGGGQLHGSQESHQSGLVAVEELELGIEYCRTCGRSRFFGQVAMVGQEWFGVGSASGSARSGPPTTIPNFGTEDDSNFGFFGVSFRLGVN